MPPIGSNRRPRPRSAASEGSNTEHNRSTPRDVPTCVPIGVLASPVLDDAIRSIAIVRARVGLGDLLCTVPALRALRAAKPGAHITLVGFAETAPTVERLGVDDLLPLPGWPGIPERPVRRPALETFVAEARFRRFDLAIQMY